jgi:glycosyltransferase family protein
VDKILSDKCSMVRFGDGEMGIILGGSIGFQIYDEELAEKLCKILGGNEKNLLVCIPDIFEGLEEYKNKSGKAFWMRNLISTRKEWERICVNKNYYNAFISRPYNMFLDVNKAKYLFGKIKTIWDNADVILVEGKYSRLGCGNNLFDNTKSLSRILCPSKNAYNKYEKILETVKVQDKSKLILIALGPAAKPIAFDLYKTGYRVLDIGHLDIEYEWYLHSAKEKIRIEGKYVNEADGGDKDLTDFHDEKYENEIIAEIK